MNSASPREQARVCTRAGDLLGEGPIWDHRSQRLLWVDILRGIVHSWTPANGTVDVLRADLLIGAVALAGESDLLLATSRGLMRWIASSGELTLLVNPIAGQPVRFNDGRVDAAGRFWIGTMALDPAQETEPLGVLYRFDPDGRIEQMEEGLTISNGIDWSLDGRTLYLTDTMRRLIYAYDFDPSRGTLSKRRVFTELDEASGHPDGLVVDGNGHIWSACFGGGKIARYSQEGKLLETVRLPVSCPTSLTFGGPNLADTFVTTSQHVLKPGHGETDAGSLLMLSLGARGRAAAIFGNGLGQ